MDKKIKFVWDWQNPAVRDVLKIMGPATLSSGMLQINVFTDLFFASGIPLAAAGLGYATLLIQTPLGLISNSLIIFIRLLSCVSTTKFIKYSADFISV